MARRIGPCRDDVDLNVISACGNAAGSGARDVKLLSGGPAHAAVSFWSSAASSPSVTGLSGGLMR